MKDLKTIILLTLSVSFLGCATSETRKEVEERTAHQPSREFHGEVAFKGVETIENSPNLSQNQKMQIRELHARMQRETFQAQNEMSKLKAVLFETLLEKPYPRKKIAVIKEKLLKLNDKKMTSMFQALDDFEKIIGESQEREKFYRDYWQYSL